MSKKKRRRHGHILTKRACRSGRVQKQSRQHHGGRRPRSLDRSAASGDADRKEDVGRGQGEKSPGLQKALMMRIQLDSIRSFSLSRGLLPHLHYIRFYSIQLTWGLRPTHTYLRAASLTGSGEVLQ